MQKNTSNIIPKARPSLAEFLRGEQKQFPDIPQALTSLLYAISLAAKEVSKKLTKANLLDIIGTQGTYNATGDEQQKLDIIAQAHFVHSLEETREVCAVVSEEEEGILELANKHGTYVVALDPLDGSPNVEVNAPVGTIFSIYRRLAPLGEAVQQEDVLQEGEKQIAAGYILYSTATTLVYTAGYGVDGFIYDPAIEEFFLSYPKMQMPKDGKTYAINDGYFDIFPSYVQQYIRDCRRRNYSARYMGALVADFHKHLLQGGIYMYPPTQKNPEGKLRLALECNALSFVAKQAGGTATNGRQSILAIKPTAIHQRVPMYIGSVNMIERLLAYIV